MAFAVECANCEPAFPVRKWDRRLEAGFLDGACRAQSLPARAREQLPFTDLRRTVPAHVDVRPADHDRGRLDGMTDPREAISAVGVDTSAAEAAVEEDRPARSELGEARLVAPADEVVAV